MKWPILTRILFVSATNYSGTGFQLCYLVDCYDNITVGQHYPTTDFPIPEEPPVISITFFIKINCFYPVNLNKKKCIQKFVYT